MIIGLHVNVLDDRGSGIVVTDYALALQNLLGHQTYIISSKKYSIYLERFNGFNVILYDQIEDLPSIIDKHKIDLLYMSRWGGNSEFTPTNCKTAIHAIFDMRQPHGTVLAGVSEWLARYFEKELWVPHIIDVPKVNETLRDELNISKDALVVGRHGAYNQFDLFQVHEAIFKTLMMRPDIWFVFLNTIKFIDHDRALFLPYNPDVLYRSKFINTCDMMIHARMMGESFGLAVAEFSALNKPVMTYDGHHNVYMRAHIDMLGDAALLYTDENDLITKLLNISKSDLKNKDWDRYSVRFSPKNVIAKFEEVFIK